MATLATDTFTRTVPAGWGTSDSGDTWTAIAGGTQMSVDGVQAVNAHTSAERNIAGVLGMTPAVDLDVTAVWSLDEVPTGGVAGPRLFARYTDGANDYHARVLAAAGTGALTVGLYRGDAAVLVAPVSTGVALTAGSKVRSRVQAIGTSPTTLKAKVWLDGTAEPDWQVVGTDSTSALQAAARPGIRIGLAGGTAVPLTSRIDSFVVTDGATEDPGTGKVGAHVVTSPAHDSLTVGVDLLSGSSLVAVLSDAQAREITRHNVATDPTSGWGHVTFRELSAGTQYAVTLEVDGALQRDATITTRTLPAPGVATSFVMVTGSCQFTGSNHPVWDAIAADSPVVLAHMGDLHYGDATTVATWRASVEASLTAARFQALLEGVPMTWTWDNHDRIIADDGGPGTPLNLGRTDPATNAEWRKLAGADGWASADTAGRTFVVGRVRFIQTDQWTARDDPDAGTAAAPLSFLGAAQKQWWKDTLDAATEPVIVWLCQWTGQNHANGRWNSFPDETAELEAWLDARPGIKARMVMIGGDSHSVQVTDGTRTRADGQRFAGIPNYNISGFNRSADGIQGGPGWLVDAALRGPGDPEADWGGYSRVTVTDHGPTLTLLWEGVRVDSTGATDVMASRTLTFQSPSRQPWDAVYIGDALATAAYVGDVQVWP
ncbi:hypothetical protein G3H63_15540 [Microbacterium resistens]|uniref:hypothetical protein n=1 Tax=Microbacterium resistens TaxID=156977 RepID=UPI001C569F3C|nr:hypothetical protein [Microbacterium resistens]MBW1640477.1 hypothetical protein [Microbacterium resistens]